MKIVGVCLGTAKEQIAGGEIDVIEPKGVEIPDKPVPVKINFGDKVIGYAKVELVKGRLHAEITVKNGTDIGSTKKLATGVVAENWPDQPEVYIVEKSRLYDISLVDVNNDKGVPNFQKVEE